GRLDRFRDGRRRIGDHVVRHGAEQDAVAAALPLDDTVAGRLAAVAGAERRPRDLADPQELAPELVARDLVEHAVTDPVDGEDALVGLRLAGDDALVRANLGLAGLLAAAAASR